MSTIRMKRGLIDFKDLGHVQRLGINPVFAEPCPLGRNGVVNPHVTRFHHKDGKVTDVFHIKPVYYEARDGSWRPMSEIAVKYGNKNIVLKMGWGKMMSLRYFQWLTKRQRLFGGTELLVEGLVLQPAYYEYATVSTFYPDPHPESTTVDGNVRHNGSVYSTMQGATTGTTASDTDAGGGAASPQHSLHSSIYYIARNYYLFDTSDIDTDSITEAIFSIYADGAFSDTDDDTIELVSSNPNSNTAIATSDYNKLGTTSYGSFDITDIEAGYCDITLNSTGRSAINKTGITKFGTRQGRDISATAPTGLNQGVTYFADYTGTTRDPKLAVTHSPATTTVNSNFFAFM